MFPLSASNNNYREKSLSLFFLRQNAFILDF
jgi:hypothetical protein